MSANVFLFKPFCLRYAYFVNKFFGLSNDLGAMLPPIIQKTSLALVIATLARPSCSMKPGTYMSALSIIPTALSKQGLTNIVTVLERAV